MNLRDQIVSVMTRPGIEATEAFDPNSEIGQKVQYMTEFVTAGVNFLRSKFPDPGINRLMGLVWDLIGNRVTPVAFGPPVPNLSITVVGSRDNPFDRKACILVPHEWLTMISADHIMQMGALVFVGSQAADFYCNKLVGQTEAIERARAYESEYLLTIERLTTGWKPNQYQKQVIAAFPDGIASAKDVMYEYRKYVNTPVLSHGEGHWTNLSRKH